MNAFRRPVPREPLDERGLLDYAIATLARRMRSVRDLRRLMKLRVPEGEVGERLMDRVVAKLEELRYLSDERFAADFTRLRKENQSHGQRRVRQDLAAKGVRKDLVEEALTQAYGDVEELTLAERFVERKRMRPPNNDKETARVIGRLTRAGFGSTTIWKLLRHWQIDVGEQDLEASE